MNFQSSPPFWVTFLMVFAVTGSSFNRNHITVWFDPFVSIADKVMPSAYDVNGLIPMISTISLKFSKIMVGKMERFGDIAHSQALVASAVATFNKLHLQPDQAPMELMMTFSYPNSSNRSLRTPFEIVKSLADKANHIYPGTVKRLYFDYHDLSTETTSSVIAYLTHAQATLKNTGYELGAHLPIQDCGGQDLPKHFLPMLPLVGHMIFYRFPNEDELVKGPDAVVQDFSRQFSHCNLKIKSQNGKFSVGYESHWSYSNSVSLQKSTNDLVSFWKKMSDWASNSNVMIVMSEAFDNPWKPETLNKQGWWRLIENPLYYHSSQYVFEEKKTGLKIVTKLTSKILNLNDASASLLGTPDSRFQTVAWFEPYVSTQDINHPGSYDVNGLIPMISKIFSKFDKIMVRIHESHNTANSQALVPSAVATFNAQLEPPKSHMETLMTFPLNLKNGVVTSPLNLVKTLADKANEIYPGTVKRIYFETDILSSENTNEFEFHLKHVQNELIGTEYELGARLHISHCGGQKLPTYLQQVLPHVRHIFFYHYEGTGNFKEAGTTVPELTRHFMSCFIKMRAKDENISVGFGTGWLFENGTSSATNDANLVEFWEKMMDWAIKSNVTLVLHEAFDSPYKSSSFKHMGWWRLIENSTYLYSSQYVFEEKRAGIVLKLTTSQPHTTLPPDVSTTTALSTLEPSRSTSSRAMFSLAFIYLCLCFMPFY